MEDKSTKLPSNEEVIEELTKNLEDSCIQKDDASSQKESPCESNDRTNFSEDIENFNDIENKHDGEEASESKNDAQNEIPHDFVDEEFISQRDGSLTSKELEDFKNEAESLKVKGNELFKDSQYESAITVYTQALNTCPLTYLKDRAILYANRAAAKSKHMTDKESAIADCTKAIELNPNYVKAYLRRAQLYEATEKLDEALEDYKKILTFDPAHMEANYGVQRLPALIQERNEKLKEEVLGKLKDLGNLVLRPFGLSTNNFELQKNPDSDGYSVKFRQNPT